MVEAAVALGILLLLTVAAVVHALAPFEPLLYAGAALVTLGMVGGIPFGIVYHVRLYQALRGRGELVPRWWLRPISLNPPRGSREYARVMPWCHAGAAGIGVAFVGCGLLLLAVLAAP
jgi:hypothetical protein